MIVCTVSLEEQADEHVDLAIYMPADDLQLSVTVAAALLARALQQGAELQDVLDTMDSTVIGRISDARAPLVYLNGE